MIIDILLESKKQYEEKLDKLIAERDEIIEKKCEELRETLKNVRNPEIDKLKETIAAFDELINKEREKSTLAEVIDEKPISEEEIQVYEKVEEETKDEVIPESIIEEEKEPEVEEIVEETEIKPTTVIELKEVEVKEEAKPKFSFQNMFKRGK